MREIKFRIFDGKEMQEVGVIDFDDCRSMDYYNWYDGYSGQTYGFDKYPLMQFTGLKDKSGVEIWEGDIVHQFGYSKGFNHQVVFYGSRFCLMLPGNIHTDYIHSPNVEVIGNIYEHPHLLKT